MICPIMSFQRQYGNFDENQNRILDYGLFRDKMHNEGVDLPSARRNYL